jgi:hypothetical protein
MIGKKWLTALIANFSDQQGPKGENSPEMSIPILSTAYDILRVS